VSSLDVCRRAARVVAEPVQLRAWLWSRYCERPHARLFPKSLLRQETEHRVDRFDIRKSMTFVSTGASDFAEIPRFIPGTRIMAAQEQTQTVLNQQE